MFFVWAVIIVAFVLTLLMLALNVYFVIKYYKTLSTSSHGIFWAFVALLASSCAFNTITITVGACSVCANSQIDITDFPVPHIILCICCCAHGGKRPTREDANLMRNQQSSDEEDGITDQAHSTPHGGCSDSLNHCSRIFLLWLAGYFFSLFLILVSYHGAYIILGSVASPVMALSHIAFYIASISCLVAFLALFLKVTNDSKCDELYQNHCTLHCKSITKICFRNLPPVFAVFLFVLCVIGFGVFYFLWFKITVMAPAPCQLLGCFFLPFYLVLQGSAERSSSTP